MGVYDDSSFDLYICPECKEEYIDFDDMMNCYKGHFDREDNK